ncbi:hypothetical protein DRN98_04635 [Methanosarcinales archaeon]|uniref:Uncharacterized protein n=1 Tax=Candidatus Syntropharchaeum caldarium TaxID=1838285 RepID=A0A1F2PA58_9EURY|nr:MAG: conserved hypothetical protein, membrane [Candidatus Syntrophoarchaeum caldarius]RLG32901.1 MAG: hypothetical protein DRN98_04635 [Methanosarcinales archaeon]
METRDIVFSLVMVISAFALTYRWLNRWEVGDPVIVLSAMVLVGALASLLLSIETRLKRIEAKIDAKERSVRVSIQSMEENVDRQLQGVITRMYDVLEQLGKRVYR